MQYDLVVVGSSFASSFFLKKYLEKSGTTVRVLVLEGGDFYPHAQRLESARTKPYGKVGYVSGRSAPIRNQNPDKPWIFDTSFGGSSNCWTGCAPRFMPNDFRMKSTYGVGHDWPVQYDDLAQYYEEAERIMAISGPEITPFPKALPYPQVAHRLSTVDKVLQKEYGPLYISQPTARSSTGGIRNACCTSAICHLCPVGAKFTIENGLMEIYRDPRVEIRYGAMVQHLDTRNDHALSAVYKKDGSEFVVQASAFALGANAIFNPHILLQSGDTNANTGKYLSEQEGYYCYLYLDGLENTGGSSIITANGYMLYDGGFRSHRAACLIENHNDN